MSEYRLLKAIYGDSRSYFRKEGTDEVVVVLCHPKETLVDEEMEKMTPRFKSEKFNTYDLQVTTTSQLTHAHGFSDKKIEELSEKRFITESYEDYLTNIDPVIKKQKIPWMEKLVAGESEKDAVLYHDDHFVLAKDMTWRDDVIPRLHVLAVVNDSEIKSLRDLTADHLPLLRHIYETGCAQIEKNCGVPRDELKCYFHYHPSYWWLHLHFSHIDNNDGCGVDRCHEFHRVCQNLEIKSDYYQTVALRIRERKWS